MKALSDNISEKVEVAIGMLKNFQHATVERVDFLFQNGQRRVLVADEVGLGKTMIARGTIALMAQHLYNKFNRTFKVIYVCSNQSIAKQNIADLDVFDAGYETDITNTRLSMQHLYIEQTNQQSENKPLQLISLTPQTSFNQKSGQGMVNERVLIYCVLKRMYEFSNDSGLCGKLEQMLMYKVNEQSWSWGYKHFDTEVDTCNNKNSKYLETLHSAVRAENGFWELLQYLRERPVTKVGAVAPGDLKQVILLRKLFAKISVQQLKPDLVIMDEFQNFQFLLNTDDTEIKTLTDCFFGNTESQTDSGHITNVLLLSATPYKLYTTLEEIGDANSGDHYSEFMEVMKFLYNKDERLSKFNNVWQDYSTALKEISKNGTTMILAKKKAAEEEMYGAVCRTERISVMDNGDYIDDSSKGKALEIKEQDVKAYMQAAELMQCIDSRFRVEYVKSCPFPLSFMNNYIEKKRLREFFKNNPAAIGKANKKLLWVDKNKINRYKELPPVNARFEQLKENIFRGNSELLLWMPPCCPYYEPYGVYAGKEEFSKILIFSSWEMVPRMIGSLVSYEEERRTIGELVIHKDGGGEQRPVYFLRGSAKKNRTRYPTGRLRPSVLPMFSLIYPSNALKKAYEPMHYFSAGIKNVGDIENCVKEAIKTAIKETLNVDYDTLVNKEGIKDRKWYYLGPMLLDAPEDVVSWIDSVVSNIREQGDENLDMEDVVENNADNKTDNGSKSLSGVIATIRQLFIDEDGAYRRPDLNDFGPVPADFLNVMASFAMASPAVCLYRTLENRDFAAIIARDFVRYFNSPENTAVVELALHQKNKKKKQSDDSHWLDVLNYCKMGNIQAMLDEFVHLLRKGHALKDELRNIEARFHECLTLHSSPYNVESYNEFKASITPGKTTRPSSRLRTHFGAGFSKGDSTDKTIARKDNLRNAFNSPFWPFVLASTSIGQEGLDFHLYCRKIMHWNLPTNPVDLEQREGRINRFKCLAIRQNIEKKYSDIKTVVKDCWDEMFDKAVAERTEGESDLIPYWCFGKEQQIKIERILPLYPISKDTDNYARLIKVLSLYRLTLGQTRQEDLLEHLFDNFEDPETLKKLFIDLSPFSHSKAEEQLSSENYSSAPSGDDTGTPSCNMSENLQE